MEHFYNYPTTIYDPEANMKMTNIFVRARIREAILNNRISYYNYRVREGDTPEIISDKYYGHTRYTWLVLYANNIIDPQFDWPMSDAQFISYLAAKYKTGTQEDYEVIASLQSTIHHYENAKGQTVLSTDIPAPTAVTYFDWESELNDSKREIKIIDSRYLSQIIEDFNKIFR